MTCHSDEAQEAARLKAAAEGVRQECVLQDNALANAPTGLDSTVQSVISAIAAQHNGCHEQGVHSTLGATAAA